MEKDSTQVRKVLLVAEVILVLVPTRLLPTTGMYQEQEVADGTEEVRAIQTRVPATSTIPEEEAVLSTLRPMRAIDQADIRVCSWTVEVHRMVLRRLLLLQEEMRLDIQVMDMRE